MHVYGNIVMKECVEKDLTRRRLAVKDSTSKSWFVVLREILCKYGLSFFLSFYTAIPHCEDYVQVKCVLKPRCKKCMEKGMNKR